MAEKGKKIDYLLYFIFVDRNYTLLHYSYRTFSDISLQCLYVLYNILIMNYAILYISLTNYNIDKTIMNILLKFEKEEYHLDPSINQIDETSINYLLIKSKSRIYNQS